MIRSEVITEFTCSDFDYVEKVLDFYNHKFCSLNDLFSRQLLERARGITKKMYVTRIIKDIIITFWKVVCEMMVNDGYVLNLPMNTVKIGVGTVDRLAKGSRPRPDKPNMGMPTYCRLIVKDHRRNDYPLYNIYLHKKYTAVIMRNIANRNNYRIFNVEQ